MPTKSLTARMIDRIESSSHSRKQLAAEIQKEIGRKEHLGDEELQRNIARTQELLRLLKDEQARRTPSKRPPEPTASAPPVGITGKLPKRDAIALALDKLGVASPPARVSALAEALFGVRISASQFASFRKADERSYRSNPRSRIYLVPALSAADLSGMAGTLTLSSWPFERRAIGGYSQRVDAMQVLVNAYADYQQGDKQTALAILKIVGREYPSIATYGDDFAAMAEAAATELEQYQARDGEERRVAAERTRRLDLHSQLFGRPPLAVIGSR
jgi:hypothetical protein